MLRAILIASLFLVQSQAALAQNGRQIESTVASGMTITTCDCYANVEVRVRSFGPGACATEITVGDRTVNLLAPPGVFTSWVIVASHSGARSCRITQSDICETGAQAQVRYWAP